MKSMPEWCRRTPLMNKIGLNNAQWDRRMKKFVEILEIAALGIS